MKVEIVYLKDKAERKEKVVLEIQHIQTTKEFSVSGGNCTWLNSADCGRRWTEVFIGGGCYTTSGRGCGGGGSGYVNTSKLTSFQTIAGNQSFPNVAGTGNETGHSGNGAAKITPVN